MNEEKIKELEAQIEELKNEKPRTDREILESNEKLLKKILDIVQAKSIEDLVKKTVPPMLLNPFQREMPETYSWKYKVNPFETTCRVLEEKL